MRDEVLRIIENFIYELNVDPEEVAILAEKLLKEIEKMGYTK